jgi:2,4-dienoyl-CoA reductase-like NADH-dependent reductase (Old Yellow Enzyme family)
VTDRLLKMYEKIAEGGCGLIITGCMSVSDDGVPGTNALRISHDRYVPMLRELFSIIKKKGAVPGAQIFHAGRQTLSAITSRPLVAASAIPCPVMKEIPIELDDSGIERVQDDFVKGAERAKNAGARLIELHGAFGYLIGGFLSPYSNKRKDRYGDDKTLFFTEIIEKVKSKIGNIPLSCRISAEEYVDGGLTLNETRKAAKKLVEAGTDVISVAAGTYASIAHMAPRVDMGDGAHVHLAGAIKKSIEVPVMCAGNIRSLKYANDIISEKKSDLVAICRPQVADPFFIKKSLTRESYIECDDCGKCLFFINGGKYVSCPRNPEL